MDRITFLRKIYLTAAMQPASSLMNRMIEEEYVPVLEKHKKKQRSQKDKDKVQEKIDEWGNFLLKKSESGNVWDAISRNQINSAMRKFGKSPKDIRDNFEDELQNALLLMTKSGSKAFIKNIPPLDLNKGLKDLKNVFGNIIYRRAIDSLIKQGKAVPTTSIHDDDERSQRLVETIEDRKTITEKEIKKLWKGLDRYVNSKTRSDRLRNDLYKIWFDMAENSTSRKIKFTDIYKELIEQYTKNGSDIPKISKTRKDWEKIRKIIVEYFEKELDYEISPALLKKLVPQHIGSDDIIKKLAFVIVRRRKIARLILQGF